MAESIGGMSVLQASNAERASASASPPPIRTTTRPPVRAARQCLAAAPALDLFNIILLAP
jgi:hypothetical protein